MTKFKKRLTIAVNITCFVRCYLHLGRRRAVLLRVNLKNKSL